MLNCLLVMPKESSMMIKAGMIKCLGSGVILKCVEEMVVIGLISVFAGFVSFVKQTLFTFCEDQ